MIRVLSRVVVNFNPSGTKQHETIRQARKMLKKLNKYEQSDINGHSR